MHIRGQEISWKTTAGVVVAAALSALSAVPGDSLRGASEVLAVAYLVVWACATCRLGFHLYEGYLWRGLWLETLIELAIVVVWAILTLATIQADDPQIPRLAVCGAIAIVLFFVGATELERARAALALPRNGAVRLRRATDVLRESSIWAEACERFRQLDSKRARKIRRWFAGRDADDGMLSKATSIALCALATIVLAAGFLALAGTILGMPLTPAPIDSKADGGGGDGSGKDDRGGQGAGEEGTGLGPSPIEASESAQGEDCVGGFDPGPRVPDPERTSLILGWRDAPGIDPWDLEALGFEIAGCPGPARRIPGSPGSWYAAGYCEDELKAVTVALAGERHPVVLLEQAAEFALPLIQGGEFLKAVDRFTVGGGDAYVIDTKRGSYVLIRENASGGPLETASDGGACGGYVDRDVPYMLAGPGLLDGWRAAAASSLEGVYPISPAQAALRDGEWEAIVLRDRSGLVASGHCENLQLNCEIEVNGETVAGHAGTRIERWEVEVIAQP